MIAGSLALTALIGGQLAASADGSMNVTIMAQQDGAWGGAPLGSGTTDTVASAGCAITSVTMMLRYYGINTDPGAINSWLSANGGYAFGDQLIWDSITAYTGGRVTFSGWLGPDLDVIHNELDAGRPVVAEVSLYGNQHFVLLTGYSTEGGLTANDPWFADSVSFADRYGPAGVVSIRTFMPADPAGARGGGRVSWTANAAGSLHLAR
ncbi:MAG: C39 family peptidase [Candidatus Dormibacteraeota bacterium]|nr:C39 family peptidase [Candidatus Dormibacteraeota bacterium]